MNIFGRLQKICIVCTVFMVFSTVSISFAGQIKPLIDGLEESAIGMTLWQMIKSGGWVMILLAMLSVVVVAIAVYDFIVLKPRILCSEEFAEDMIKKIKQGKIKIVKEMCIAENNILSRIILSGIAKKTNGVIAVREAMESCARNEIGRLWQNIGYLGDIGMIAPLIGLLGTVLGMIQAFNVVAFQMTVVKPILLAGGISKAMITTAGGLIVAIPAMMLYSYFKSKVQDIAAYIESYCVGMIELVSGE